MTVKDLIKELQTLPPNLTVVMSSDPEGNEIRELATVDTARYVKDERRPWMPGDLAGGAGKPNAACLWPG